MNCEQTTTTFSGRNITPREVRCRRAARFRAGIPFGLNVIERNLCQGHAEKRAADVLHSRGKVVSLTELTPPPAQPRDASGRFTSREKLSGDSPIVIAARAG